MKSELPISYESFIADKDVKKFTHYLSEVIGGRRFVEHGYYDRMEKRNFYFLRLIDALTSYKWNGQGYEANKALLDSYISKINLAESEQGFISACLDILEWGAGNKKLSLYTANKDWIVQKGEKESVKSNVLEALKILRSNQPDLCDFGSNYRMNAGFTKIYAFLSPSDFVIYDSRVAASLAFLVQKYCVRNDLTSVPKLLSFALADAQGSSCRDPSIATPPLRFRKWNVNQKLHAKSNVFANWILKDSLELAKKKSGCKCQFKELREVEAALFILGYDFPQFAEKNDSRKDSGGQKSTRKTSKKSIAREIYVDLSNKGVAKKEIIGRFISDANLTKKGAETYYYDIKNESK